MLMNGKTNLIMNKKMRTYKKLKSMFKNEPYLNLKDENLRK